MASTRSAVPNGERMADRTARRLQQLIADSGLQPGELLPPERQLCELLGVSRTVVREAVRSLAAKGLLEVRQGHGTVVRFPDLGTATEVVTNLLRGESGHLAFPRVHEVRRLLEVEIAGLAAERRSDGDVERLAEALAHAAQASEPDAWARADIAFHARLADATQNPLFGVLLASMAEILLELRLTASRLTDTQAHAQKYHEAIFEAVRAGSAAQARKAMRQHMAEADSTFRRGRIASALEGS
jgi:GntR family transcriptional regulator, transcriptional repressor for pyruvate dehydrogenase complex